MKMGMGLCTNMGRTGLDASQERRTVGGGVGLMPVAVVVVSKGISGPEGVKVATLSPPGESISCIAHVFMIE